ncbi:coiled-coil domain-containing protein 149 isoform X2 [Drosophila obscura]|uniref:coiled-coil domain-containing protein 149 isoform X2 n=1 Tax=Drosophila obscura TaxID=7282 RepID=UPI001BB16605|nr:coiled-coil domain-containing protein 149 isoform X2 [Drosophila obscura]
MRRQPRNLFCQCQHPLGKPMETFKMDLDLDADVASVSGAVGVSQYELSYGDHMDTYNVETSAVHRKLQSKVEALRILRQELEQFRVERDQYKLMAETLQLRYSALKRNSELVSVGGNGCGPLSQNSSLAALLHETREQNLKLNTEVEGLKQRLNELQGDMELLRETEASNKSRVQAMASENAARNKEELQWRRERANFICHLENLKKRNAQLAFDFKSIIDEKEELITERDAYKCKAHRLNHELFVALRAKKTHPKLLDIDGVLLENKYLHERVKIQEGELDLTKQSISKYKTMLDAKRKKGIVKLGGGSSSTNDETILSPRQVKTILESGIDLPQKTETIHDLKSLCLALLDNLNDKNLALTHQKKTNKILAGKMTDLEQRWQQLLAGDSADASPDHEDDEDYGYAPSQLLLNGYCAAMVDDIDISSIPSTAPDNAGGTLTPEEPEEHKHKPSRIEALHSDDGMSSLSTESVDSSVYEVDVQREDFHKSSSATTDSGNCGFGTRSNGTPRISSAVARERIEDLKDLPPHLATLVQKALHELDMRDYEAMVTIQAEHVASIH